MKWFFRIIWDPVVAFDLVDKNGEPDHGKIMGFCAFVVYTLATLGITILPSIGITVVFLAAMFGPRMFYRFLDRHSSTSIEHVDAELKLPSVNDSTE